MIKYINHRIFISHEKLFLLPPGKQPMSCIITTDIYKIMQHSYYFTFHYNHNCTNVR